MTAPVGTRCGFMALVQRYVFGSGVDPNNLVKAIGIDVARESMKRIVISRGRIGGEIHEVFSAARSHLFHLRDPGLEPKPRVHDLARRHEVKGYDLGRTVFSELPHERGSPLAVLRPAVKDDPDPRAGSEHKAEETVHDFEGIPLRPSVGVRVGGAEFTHEDLVAAYE